MIMINRDAERHALAGPCSMHQLSVTSFARALLTTACLTGVAALPHAFRIYVATSAISASDNFHPNVGMAGPVGACGVRADCTP